MIIIILDNAIKFSSERKNISISLEEKNTFYYMEITDEGRGISDDDVDKIFDRFHKSGNGNNDGMGLGLSIAKQIALRHNIDLSVKSEINRGATFSFKFFNTVFFF